LYGKNAQPEQAPRQPIEDGRQTNARLSSFEKILFGGLVAAKQLLFEQPGARLCHLRGWKKLHWCSPHSRSGKSEPLYFPTCIAHKRDLGDFAAMGQEKIQIIPIRPALPAIKVFGNDEQSRFCPGIDLSGYLLLGGGEF
jgi:hypothetical protein